MSGSRSAVVTSAKAPVCSAALASSPVSQPTNSIDASCCRNTPSIILRTTFEPSTTMMRGVVASDSRKPVLLMPGKVGSQVGGTSLPQMMSAGEPRAQPAHRGRGQQQQPGRERTRAAQGEGAAVAAGQGREARPQQQARERQQCERGRAPRQPVPGAQINERTPYEAVGGAELLQHRDLLAPVADLQPHRVA